MGPFHNTLNALTGVVVLLLFFNSYLYFRSHDRLYLALGLVCLGGAIYISCNLMLYDVTTPERYLEILKVQMVGTALYHIGLVWFCLFFLRIKQRWPLGVVSAVFGAFLVVRTIYPMLTYTSFTGMTDYLLPWNERLQIPIASVSNWGMIYMLWLYSIYPLVIVLGALRLRHERIRATQTLVCVLLLMAMATNDVLVYSLNLHWLFLAELGFTLLIVGMELAAANEILRSNQLSQKVRESEERYRKLVSASPDGITIVGMDGLITYVSPQELELHGEAHTEDVIGRSPLEWITPAHREQARKALEETFRGVDTADKEYLMLRKDGTTFWGEINAAFLTDASGQPIGLIAMTRDITERKEAEEALRESESHFHGFVEETADGIIIIDNLGKIINWNRAMERLTGLKQQQALGKSVWDIQMQFTPDEDKKTLDPEKIKLLFHQTLDADEPARQLPAREAILQHMDGSRHVVEQKLFPIKTQTGSSIGFVFHDLTERIQAEEALRRSEEKYRILVETASEGIWTIDKNHKTTFVNQSMAEMLGYTPAEMLGKKAEEFTFPEAEDIASFKEHMRRRREGVDAEVYERRLRKRDGSPLWMLVTARALKDDQGYFTGSFGMYTDITERKQAEQALRESEERYRGLLENIPANIYVVGVGQEQENPTTFMSPQMEKLLGYAREDFYTDPRFWSKLIHPDDRERVWAESERADQTGEWFVIDYRIISIENKILWFHDESVLVKDGLGQPLYRLGICTDITERKQVEDALQESEERFSRLSASTFEGIGITDQDRIVDANPQLAAMLGYEPGELIGLNSMDMVAPESRHLVMANMQAGIDGPYEHLAVKKDGTIFPVEIRARSISYHGYQTRVAIIRDITERKQAEENLARQIERLRALHTIDQAITSSMDLNTILELLVREIIEQLHIDATAVLLFNPQTQKLDFAARQGFRTEALKFTSLKVGTGLAGQAIQERKIIYIADLVKMDDNPSLSQATAEEKFVTYYGVPLIAKGKVRGVLELFHRSALTPDADWLRFLETLAGQIAISMDNARLLELTQESLKETNALYRINQDLAATIDSQLLMQNVVNLLQESFGYHYVQIFIEDPQTGDFVVRVGSGKIGEKNKEHRYHLAAGEGIVGLTADTGKPFFTNDVDKVISFVRAPFLPDTKSELAVPIKIGTRFLGLLDVHQVLPFMLTERDVQLVSAVADQLAVALQKAQLYTDLQNSLHQEQSMHSQLIQSEKLAVVGRLLASVSHELNNPLQAIQNALFLLKDEGGLSTQGKQDLEIVLSESERMATLLERLRVTYQPARAEDFQPIQINNVIEDIHTLVATTLRHARISFEFHSDPELPSIPGLGNQLRQVILNLFMNAADAMSNGGRLIVSTHWLIENREILIAVADTGAGIDESVLPKIFEAFITSKERGTGLGLAISYEIVLKHGGRIQAKNNPGGGATFSIWLPVENGDKS